MAANVAQPQPNWKEQALVKAEKITEVWEVTQAYAARLGEWVLMACLVMGIVESLPNIDLWPWVANTILGIQIVTLDIVGLSLGTLADQARANGNTKGARQGRLMAWSLIVVTMATLLSMTVGHLVPSVKPYTDDLDVALIFVRIVISVIFKFVVHSLRATTPTTIPIEDHEQKVAELIAGFTQQVQAQQEQMEQMHRALERQMTERTAQMDHRVQGLLTERLSVMEQHLQLNVTESITPLSVELHSHAEALSVLPELKAYLTQMKKSGERPVKPSEQTEKQPIQLAARRTEGIVSASFEKRQFVYECLTENADMTIADIQKRAHAVGHTLSVGSVSGYRKDFQVLSSERQTQRDKAVND